jgi:hypothetical protein
MPDVPELVAQLPFVAGSPSLIDQVGEGIEQPTESQPAFISPDLTQVAHSSPVSEAQVVLISAPGAVGKTWLARELAVELGAPLWDLGAFPVGSGTFVGKIAETHGAAALVDVINGLKSTAYCVVMDGLDEGLTLAKSDNFEAFLRDLAKNLQGFGTPGVAVVGLGRADTIDITRLILESEGIVVAELAIEYFDRPRAYAYIDKYLDLRGRTARLRHVEPYEIARGLLFERVEQALPTEPLDDDQTIIRDFLGYAPVLTAFAQYLEDDNFAARAEELRQYDRHAANDRATVWRFLRGIIEDLLIREQTKLRLPAPLRSRLEAQAGERGLYTIEEQCARLLDRNLGVTTATTPFEGPDSVEYEERVHEALVEHPFAGAKSTSFASVVFRDYLFAHALVRGSTALRTAARARSSRLEFRPTPLLARFVFDLLPQGDVMQVSGTEFPLLYESLRSQETSESTLSVFVRDLGGRLWVELVLPDASNITLAVFVEGGEPLRFWRKLANATIELSDSTVALGTSGAEFALGPNVFLYAQRIQLDANSLRVETKGDPDGLVALACEDFAVTSFDATLAPYGPRSLMLFVPHELTFPWVRHRVAISLAVGPTDEKLMAALTDLGNIVGWFKSGGYHAALGMPAKPMDTLIAKGRVNVSLFQYAESSGLIEKSGSWYVLRPEKFGISFEQVRIRSLSEPVTEFLEGYLSS